VELDWETAPSPLPPVKVSPTYLQLSLPIKMRLRPNNSPPQSQKPRPSPPSSHDQRPPQQIKQPCSKPRAVALRSRTPPPRLSPHKLPPPPPTPPPLPNFLTPLVLRIFPSQLRLQLRIRFPPKRSQIFCHLQRSPIRPQYLQR